MIWCTVSTTSDLPIFGLGLELGLGLGLELGLGLYLGLELRFLWVVIQKLGNSYQW